MSEELRDEAEAINSIYGDGSLVLSEDATDTYTLALPGRSSSLRIRFPPSYPDEPPFVAGTNSTGQHGKRGDAARELDLLRDVIGSVYQSGMVCLFDAIEEFNRRIEEESAITETTQLEDSHSLGVNESQSNHDHGSNTPQLSLPEPPWVMSDPVIELKSTFIARCAPVKSTSEAEAFVQHLLATDKKVRLATHNITAWRIRGFNNTTFQDCDDDGESAAGGRLLHLMQLMDLWDVMVIVSRWYGGHKLGPRRFALINQAARDSFIKAGFVVKNATANK